MGAKELLTSINDSEPQSLLNQGSLLPFIERDSGTAVQPFTADNTDITADETGLTADNTLY